MEQKKCCRFRNGAQGEKMKKEKECNVCHILKNFKEFHKNKQNKDGHHNICKLCLKTKREKDYEENLKNAPPFKICNKCTIEKDIDNFAIDKASKDGHYYKCKECAREVTKQFHLKNKLNNDKEIKEIKKCPQCKKIKDASCFVKNISSKDGLSAYCISCIHEEKRVFKTKIRANIVKTIKDDFKKRNIKKNIPNLEMILGYSIDDLICHLKNSFDANMNEENYGIIWSLDHIISRSAFNFFSFEDAEFKMCWVLSNLRPIQLQVNSKKSSKFIMFPKVKELLNELEVILKDDKKNIILVHDVQRLLGFRI